MEISIPSLPILAFFLLSAFILLKSKRSTGRNLPPGPRKLPLIGNMHNLIGDVPHRALHRLALKHGPLMHVQLGQVHAVVASTAETAKEVMKTHDINLASRPPVLAAEIMGYGCTSITFAPYGDYWRQLRKICTSELLTVKRVQSFSLLRQQVFSDVAKWIASMEGSPLNLSEKLHSSTYYFAALATLGRITKEQERLLPITRDIFELAAGFDIAEVYPSIKLFRIVSGVRRRLSMLHQQADKILEDIIDDHKAAMTSSENRETFLVDVLLQLQKDDALKIPLTHDNVKAVVLEMLGTGGDPSATTVDWAMAEMVKNPRVLKKAQDEVRQVFDEKGFVEESRLHELKYLKWVVKETLRLHPPASLLLPRICGETCEINGYEIPANTKVLVNGWAVNRDPNHWKDAECFQPERFDDILVDFKGNHFEYIPFGAGRRICPGMTFGLANVDYPLALLLYHFDWELPHGIKHQELDMAEVFGLTARRKQDLYLAPVITRPLPLE